MDKRTCSLTRRSEKNRIISPKNSNSLVSIAFAAALMPPLCTIGIETVPLNREVATGTSLLFLINLVSISLTGAIVFWRMTIHPILPNETIIKKERFIRL